VAVLVSVDEIVREIRPRSLADTDRAVRGLAPASPFPSRGSLSHAQPSTDRCRVLGPKVRRHRGVRPSQASGRSHSVADKTSSAGRRTLTSVWTAYPSRSTSCG